MFVVKKTGVEPPQYVFFSVVGLWEYTDRESEAIQLVRRSDGEAIASQFDEPTDVVPVS